MDSGRGDQRKPSLSADLSEARLLHQVKFINSALQAAIVGRAIATDQARIPVAGMTG
jgi:hypothetical protein